VSTISELPRPNKEGIYASNVNNKCGRRRSSSCGERRNKEGHSKALLFRPVAKLVASSESQLHLKRGILLNVAIILFSATSEFLLMFGLYGFLGSPMKGTKIPVFAKKMKKMPDFTNIHKKEFEKMESVVDCQKRKIERARTLLSPKVVKVSECQLILIYIYMDLVCMVLLYVYVLYKKKILFICNLKVCTKDRFSVYSGSAASILCPAICNQRNPIRESNDSYVLIFPFTCCW
jgi:hypothetical protein